ncbi:enoyl-CoA hydratase-related protein [Corynebacterium striatum]|uniref:enoyl-CoA hydratase-related protein n=2 Tax=Corynebacterium striatum TaxID=43770 RepID=UPI001FC8E6B7|nr:enoyl-CoA hydratase-related protein [Corynebacterium striatum]GKH17952.1 enoyl-CoA hydratase [Corynebacterium striatum]
MSSLVAAFELESGMWSVRLTRAEKRNALSVALCKDLSMALDAAVEAGASTVLLEADGPVFSAGADLTSQDFQGELYPTLEALFAKIARLPVPVIAWIEGPAIGAGMMLAMACDIRFVAPAASAAQAISFSLPVAKMGIGVDPATVRNLQLLVGGSWARRMLIAGEILSLEDALSTGFAISAGSREEVMAAAAQIGKGSPHTLLNLKMEFATSSSSPFSEEERNAARVEAWRARQQ